MRATVCVGHRAVSVACAAACWPLGFGCKRNIREDGTCEHRAVRPGVIARWPLPPPPPAHAQLGHGPQHHGAQGLLRPGHELQRGVRTGSCEIVALRHQLQQRAVVGQQAA